MLFLGGFGRSGTTLVERLLGELPGVCALGEVVHLWERGVRRNERCGCGQPFHDCAFWRRVGDEAFGGWAAVDVDRILDLKRSIDRTRFVPPLAVPQLRTWLRQRVEEYADVYARLYRAAAYVADCPVVIDSSKVASLAFCLHRAADIDLRVAHVVRDSRGVAYSWGKRIPRPEASGVDNTTTYDHMTTYSPGGAASHWVAQNLAFQLLARSRQVPTERVRYEDVVAAPATTLAGIARLAGVHTSGAAWRFLEGNVVELTASHTVAGNPMRFQTGRIPLRRDDAWRTRAPARQRALVSAMTLPLLLRYGYSPHQPRRALGQRGEHG